MSRQRVLFVATPAVGALVAGMESSARNRGHNAITVLDPRHAPSIANAFRPTVIVFLAAPHEGALVPAELRKDAGVRMLPLVVLASAFDAVSAVSAIAAGAVAVEPMEGGMPALERALDLVTKHAEHTPAQRALDALVRHKAHGALRVSAPLEALVRVNDGAVESVHAGKESGLGALAMLGETGSFVTMAFEPWVEPMQLDDAEILPLEDAPVAESELAKAVGPARILIAEDDEQLARMYRKVFEHEGFVVAVAADGRRGYELALQDPPDLIVTDIQMPHADGWALLGCVRDDARVREIPVVMVSNFTDMLGQLKGLRVGADAYIEKAGPKAELVGVVRALIERRRAARMMAASKPAPCGGRLEHIGPSGLLAALQEGKRTGTLRVAAGWGEVSVELIDGQIRGAKAQLDDVVMSGREALLLLLDLGETSWRLEPDAAPIAGGPHAAFSELKDELAATLNARRLAATVAAMTRRGLTIIEERARVYVGTADEARALVEKMSSGEAVDERTRAAFRDLVRRGVAR